jgi:hypothetical protein
MHRPKGLRRILGLGSAIARLAAVVPLGARAHSMSEKKHERRFARHTHRPKHYDSMRYSGKRKRPRGAFSMLKKTERLLAKLAAEARS